MEFRRLPFRKTVEIRVSGPGKITRLLPLRAGDFIKIVAEELGDADVTLFLWAPDGRCLLEVDTLFTGDDRTEVVTAVVRSTGTYRLVFRVETIPTAGARQLDGFRITWQTARPASPRDRLRARAHEVFAEGEVLRRKECPESLRQAHERYEEALHLWVRLGEGAWATRARHRIGMVLVMEKKFEQALKVWEIVLPAWRKTSDEPYLLRELANVKKELRRPGDALADLQRSLTLSQQAGNTAWQVDAYTQRGLFFAGEGQFQAALDSYGNALRLLSGEGMPSARVLAVRSELLMDLGDYKGALEGCIEALEIMEKEGFLDETLVPLRTLGLTYLELGDPGTALQVLQKGESRARMWKRRRELARLLNAIGNVHVSVGRHGEALEAHEEALERATDAGDQVAIAHACGNLGYLADQAGDSRTALALFDRGIAIYEGSGQRLSQAQILSGKALALWHQDRFAEAQETLEQVIGLIESLRSQPESGSLRTSFFASRQRGYEAYMELIMDRHRRQPGAGFDLLAFEAAELTRARSLLEDLGRLQVEGVTPELFSSIRQRDRTLVQALAPAPAAGEAERRARSDESESRLSTLVRSLSVRELQRLLDQQTLVLAYKLGPTKSYLWLIGRDLAVSRELPGRDLIENEVRETLALLARSSEHAVRAHVIKKAARLTDLLLEPVAEQLENGKRLVVIPDGELHSLPFAVLPDPVHLDKPLEGERWWPVSLVENHELVYEPSASVLALVREQKAGRPLFVKTLALLAPEADGTLSRAASSGDGKLATLPPLPFSQQEAQAIRERVEASRRTVAIGVDADLRFVRSPLLGRHSILHFAGHALVDTADVASSGLVLAGSDPGGRPRRDLLSLEEIHGLNLPVDLVVLSACSTGRGVYVPGEGLVGLTRAFLYAGSSRVVASLWNIRDQATSHLMDRFYDGMLDRGLPAAAALREAQVSMLHSGHRQAPYYWGGFVLQGEWQ